jgi:preprotein translocase subunit SecE
MLERIKVFFQESKQELKRVNWPTRQQTIRYTLFVIGISAVVAVFLGFFDFIFLRFLGLII